MFLRNLLLTDAWNHNTLEALDVNKQYALLDAFNELIMKDGNINRNDIIRVFTEYGIKEDVYDKFYSDNENFGVDLETFNDRKDELRTLGLEGFMESHKKDYKALYSRFYTTFKKDDLNRIMLFIDNRAVRDYSAWIATDYYFSKNPDPEIYFTISMDYLDYRPRMFKYW